MILFVAMLRISKTFGRLDAIYAKTLLVGGFSEIEAQTELGRYQEVQIKEESMEIKEEGKFEIDQRPPTLVIVVSVAFLLFVIGLVVLAFLATR